METEKMTFNSIHDLHIGSSFQGEQFFVIPMSWQSRIEALKIRVAQWTPYHSRKNSAFHYYEVMTISEAKELLKYYQSFDFRSLQEFYEAMFIKDNVRMMNTGETSNWTQSIFLPAAKSKFRLPAE